jgi:hypothetical protein
MKIQVREQTIDLSPFVKAGVLTLIGSLALLFVFDPAPNGAMQVFFIFFGLAVSDLFFLVKTIAATLHLMSDQGAENRTAYAIQAFVYGGLKLLCLAAIGLFLWKLSDASSLGILLGLSALVAIPLGGGFWWSQSQLKSGKSIEA